jgi:hypothetical protein
MREGERQTDGQAEEKGGDDQAIDRIAILERESVCWDSR